MTRSSLRILNVPPESELLNACMIYFEIEKNSKLKLWPFKDNCQKSEKTKTYLLSMVQRENWRI